ncbi:MAG: alkaline phosphatase family protein [Planctomycetaceae bacterium]
MDARPLYTLLATCTLVAAGCSPQSRLAPLTTADAQVSPDAIFVRGDGGWVDTGIDVRRGEALSISATGRVRISRLKSGKDDSETEVGPQGTYFYNDALTQHDFPLPAAGKGPAPCFCLIGRIGQGPIVFVGQSQSIVAERSGRLWLAINDFDGDKNAGEFYAQVQKPLDVQPVEYRTVVPVEATAGETAPLGPAPNASVVVFYIDGLRPDVVEEMAAMGHVPHLRKYFVDGGAWLQNTFTAFPSDTITSNGTMWTGCFSDRHGLKGQVRFSRARLASDSFLEPLGPHRSAQTLGPKGLDKVVHEAEAAAVGLVGGADAANQWRGSQTSATPALYDYMRERGQDWATGVLPIMTEVPPLLWTRSMARCLPYLQAQEAWRYIDDANAHFAVRHLIRQYRPVTIIWLPETDSVSHKECRGQFGSTRRTIARADKLVGSVVAELAGQNRLGSTYLILVSDHGHLGGATTHLSRFDISNELFFAAREVTRNGRWVGGGLGMSVRQHRSANWHKGDSGRQFVFVDGDSDGAARIFLPRGGYRSGDWAGPNSPAQLLAYPIEAHLEPINVPLTLAHTTAVHDDGTQEHPIDLVLMKTGENSILITTCDRGQATIERRRDQQGRWEYRYTPVSGVAPAADGGIVGRPVTDPQTDPLGLVGRVRTSFLRQFHDEQAWLLATAGSDYPDGVVTLTRHMLWQESIRQQEQEYAPDLVVTARYGWLFATQNTPGTTHGYPLAESVRATFYVSGPNIRRGARLKTPCRLADLTPTILMLTNTDYDAARLDGRALASIFAVPDEDPPVRTASYEDDSHSNVYEKPLYWVDFDLHAWQPLKYNPAPAFGHQPLSINQPASGWDMNNIAYNVLSIGDWSVFRMVDDLLSPLTPGRTKFNQTLEKIDQRIGHNRRPWVGDGVQALNIPGVTLADYSLTSLGNMQRVNKAVDWLQERGTRVDDKLATKAGRRTILGAPATNTVIDAVQDSFWELYRFAQRVIVQVLDEVVLNSVENGVDATINSVRSTPSEVLVDEPGP